MSDLSIANETKNTLAISNEAKPSAGKWNSSPTRTWGDGGTWGVPGTFMVNESKNTLAITPENKP